MSFIIKKQQFTFALIFLALIAPQLVSAKYSANPRLGINVGSLDKLGTSSPFTDIFKISRGWFTSCSFDWRAQRAIDPDCTKQNAFNTREQSKLILDGNGWVVALPQPQDAPIYTSVTSTWRLAKNFPIGRFVALYEGRGKMKIEGDIKILVNRPGHIEFDMISSKRNLRLNISQTDPQRNGNYIRNIRIVPKKYEHTYQRQVFNPDYLARIRDLEGLRLMPWSNPRSNEDIEWSDRTRIGTAHYISNNGMPIERMIDLANQVDATPWLSVPYKASDDYFQKYARLVKTRLRPNQKVYIELSNEVWNSIFPSATYAARQADSFWGFPYKDIPQGKRRVLLAANWYAKRSVELCQIVKKEFGGQRNRVKCVVGSLTSVPWIGKEILDCPLFKQANGCGRHFDAYGIAPYFGDYIARKENRGIVKQWTNDPDGGFNRLFKEILQGGEIPNGPVGGSMTRLQDHLAKNKALANKYNLELVAYEAGQHLIRYDPPHQVKDPRVLDLFMNAQKDPRMQQAYDRYLRTWAQGGGGVMYHYYGIGEPTPKNFFGMLDHLYQPTSPKYAALMNYLGTQSNYVPPQRNIPPPPIAQQQPVAQRQQQNSYQPTTPVVPVQQTSQYTQPVFQNPKPVQTVSKLSGKAIQNWSKATQASAISPPVNLAAGRTHTFSILWQLTNIQKGIGQQFKVYAIDHRGGRKLLLQQTDLDFDQIGTNWQIFEDDFSRYVGPPIRIQVETVNGLGAIIEDVKF